MKNIKKIVYCIAILEFPYFAFADANHQEWHIHNEIFDPQVQITTEYEDPSATKLN
jgi:hypothetical protein